MIKINLSENYNITVSFDQKLRKRFAPDSKNDLKLVQKLILINLSLPWVDFLNDFAYWVDAVNFDDFGDDLDVCDDGGGDGCEDLEFKKDPYFRKI